MGPFHWRYYLSWNGRIGPRDYVVGQQVIGTAGAFAAAGPFLLLMFWAPSLAGIEAAVLEGLLILVVMVLLIPGSSLTIRRAHDLGWPAVVPLAALLVLASFAAAFLASFGAFGPGAADARWLEIATSMPMVLVVVAANGLLSFWLMSKKGQAEPNRYGPAPSSTPPETRLPSTP